MRAYRVPGTRVCSNPAPGCAIQPPYRNSNIPGLNLSPESSQQSVEERSGVYAVHRQAPEPELWQQLLKQLADQPWSALKFAVTRLHMGSSPKLLLMCHIINRFTSTSCQQAQLRNSTWNRICSKRQFKTELYKLLVYEGAFLPHQDSEKSWWDLRYTGACRQDVKAAMSYKGDMLHVTCMLCTRWRQSLPTRSYL